MHNDPSVQDILDSLKDYLLKEVMPLCKGNDALSFRNLVAWNMLGVIGREIGNDEAPSLLLEKYQALLKVSNSSLAEMRKELAAQIRSGEIAWDSAGLIALLSHDVDQRLKVSNPRFSRDKVLDEHLETSR